MNAQFTVVYMLNFPTSFLQILALLRYWDRKKLTVPAGVFFATMEFTLKNQDRSSRGRGRECTKRLIHKSISTGVP
jgi:hypothetical protein